jgi:Fe-S cluster assembly ATP-binding protein
MRRRCHGLRGALTALALALQLEELKMDMRYLTRNVNEGFSGGEKKRNEILQVRPSHARLEQVLGTPCNLACNQLTLSAPAAGGFGG